MKLNFLVIAIAAIIPMVLGFIWYHSKVFGTAWMNVCGFKEEDLKGGGNMLLIFIVSYVFCLMLASTLPMMVIHQNGFFQTLINEPGLQQEGTDMYLYAQDFMNKYGNNFRTFGHGALHGGMAGLFFALPVLAINAMFEKKGAKYIAINAGYWVVCLALMGGVICQFS